MTACSLYDQLDALRRACESDAPLERALSGVLDVLWPRLSPADRAQRNARDESEDATLFSVKRRHLAALRACAETLDRPGASPNDQAAATTIMEVVRYAEAVEALRGPGEPYVHLCLRRGIP